LPDDLHETDDEMSDHLTLRAEARERTGKGSARSLRRAGHIPAIVYGEREAPESISVVFNDMRILYNSGHFYNTICAMQIGDRELRVIPYDVQLDPVRDVPLHVDFLRLGKDSTIDVDVTVHFVNEGKSPGLKSGGVLNIVRHEIELRCPAESIPNFIEIDLTGLEIGDSIHISSVTLPEGVKPTIERDFTIATIAAPTVQSEEKPEAVAEEVAAEATPAETGEKKGKEE
jgi:large subunit ribosomal protein L25